MPRLDVHEGRGDVVGSYVLDVQADLLSGLTTRGVVPLVLIDQHDAVARALDVLLLGF